MIESGRTIAGKIEKPKSDSERERAKKYHRKQKITAGLIALILGGFLVFMTFKAGVEFFKLITREREEVEVEISPTIKVIDEETGSLAKMSSRTREYIANLETELRGRGIVLAEARIPKGKLREVDLTLRNDSGEEVSGYFKVSLDRGIGVTAEDIERMIKYLEREEIEEFEYIDVRVERKAYLKV